MLNPHLWQVTRAAFCDWLSARYHSHDFDYYRSELIITRVRQFAALFGLASPVWIPIDRWLLNDGILNAMMVLRVAAGLALLLLAVLPVRPTLGAARARASLLVVIILAFYLTVQYLTGATFESPALIGYTALPLLLVAVLALLPLTLIESALLLLLTALTVLFIHDWLGFLTNKGVLGLLWVLLLFAGFTLAAQAIHMRLLLLIHRQSTCDSLTGLLNRGALLRRAGGVLQEASKRNLPYCVLMFDLDRFKQINDTRGHPAGDSVLRTVGAVLEAQMSAQCLVGRFGGEEFLLLMGSTTIDEARERAEQLRQAIAALVVATEQGPLTFTTSVGIAEGRPGDTLEEVIARADEALYSAKETGRNRVVG